MKQRKISREFLVKYLLLLDEGCAIGVTIIPHCSECKAEIELMGERTVSESLTITFNPATDIDQGRCECSIWKIEEER